MKRDFAGKVVVITGAGSGIGRATALAFARAGAGVHAVDIDGERASAVAGEIRAAGGEAVAHATDCTDPEAVARMAREVLDAHGRVDVLHNNAGVCYAGPVEQAGLQDWRWIIDLNLWGVIHGLRAFLPGMLQRRSGAIVNTASMAGLIGIPYVVPYCATKFAVVGLSEALALELATRGVQVTLVCPGMVRSNVLGAGRFHLPGPWQERIQRLYARLAQSPDSLATDIVDAVRKRRFLVVSGPTMVPLWMIRRLSNRFYQRAGALILRGLLGRSV